MRRVLHHVRGRTPGPTLIGIGGLHGNEPAGVRALDRVGATISRRGLAQGEFVALAGNLPALAAGVRYIDRDLNRIWGEPDGRAGEEAGQRAELRQVLLDIRARASGPVHLLDLHTTSGEGPPFAVTDEAQARLALTLAVPVVFGLGEAIPGTLVHALARAGVAGIAFEAGPHDDPASEARSADALWLVLAALGMVRASRPRVREARRRLVHATRGHPRALELVHRHALDSPGRFRMRPGFRSFQEVRRGDLLALSGDDEVRSPVAGRLLLPLYQSSGEDGFFVAQPLGLSHPPPGRGPSGPEVRGNAERERGVSDASSTFPADFPRGGPSAGPSAG